MPSIQLDGARELPVAGQKSERPSAPTGTSNGKRVQAAKSASKQKYRKIAEDDTKFEAFAFALTGKTAEQRTPAENRALKQLRREMKNGEIDPEFVEATPANGTGPDRLPMGVRGAYVSGGANGQGRVLISHRLRGKQLQRTSDEEQGEAVAGRAAALGIKVADGDAGARVSSVANGKPVAKDSVLFKDDASDSTTVVSNGRRVEAEADAQGGSFKRTTITVEFKKGTGATSRVEYRDENGNWVHAAEGRDGQGNRTFEVPGHVAPDDIRITNKRDGGIYQGNSGNARVSIANGSVTIGFEDKTNDKSYDDVTVTLKPAGASDPSLRAERDTDVTIHVDPSVKDHTEFFYRDPNTGEWVSMGDTRQRGPNGIIRARVPAGLGTGDFAVVNHSQGGAWIRGGQGQGSQAFGHPGGSLQDDGIMFNDRRGRVDKSSDGNIKMFLPEAGTNRATRTERTNIHFKKDAKDDVSVYYKDPVTGEWILIASKGDADENGNIIVDLPPGVGPSDLAIKNHSKGHLWITGSTEGAARVDEKGNVGFEDRNPGSHGNTGEFNDVTVGLGGSGATEFPDYEGSRTIGDNGVNTGISAQRYEFKVPNDSKDGSGAGMGTYPPPHRRFLPIAFGIRNAQGDSRIAGGNLTRTVNSDGTVTWSVAGPNRSGMKSAPMQNGGKQDRYLADYKTFSTGPHAGKWNANLARGTTTTNAQGDTATVWIPKEHQFKQHQDGSAAPVYGKPIVTINGKQAEVTDVTAVKQPDGSTVYVMTAKLPDGKVVVIAQRMPPSTPSLGFSRLPVGRQKDGTTPEKRRAIVQQMKPATAAAYLAALPPKEAATILAQMNPDQRAAVIAEMEPAEIAVLLSELDPKMAVVIVGEVAKTDPQKAGILLADLSSRGPQGQPSSFVTKSRLEDHSDLGLTQSYIDQDGNVVQVWQTRGSSSEAPRIVVSVNGKAVQPSEMIVGRTTADGHDMVGFVYEDPTTGEVKTSFVITTYAYSDQTDVLSTLARGFADSGNLSTSTAVLYDEDHPSHDDLVAFEKSRSFQPAEPDDDAMPPAPSVAGLDETVTGLQQEATDDLIDDGVVVDAATMVALGYISAEEADPNVHYFLPKSPELQARMRSLGMGNMNENIVHTVPPSHRGRRLTAVGYSGGASTGTAVTDIVVPLRFDLQGPETRDPATGRVGRSRLRVEVRPKFATAPIGVANTNPAGISTGGEVVIGGNSTSAVAIRAEAKVSGQVRGAFTIRLSYTWRSDIRGKEVEHQVAVVDIEVDGTVGIDGVGEIATVLVNSNPLTALAIRKTFSRVPSINSFTKVTIKYQRLSQFSAETAMPRWASWIPAATGFGSGHGFEVGQAAGVTFSRNVATGDRSVTMFAEPLVVNILTSRHTIPPRGMSVPEFLVFVAIPAAISSLAVSAGRRAIRRHEMGGGRFSGWIFTAAAAAILEVGTQGLSNLFDQAFGRRSGPLALPAGESAGAAGGETAVAMNQGQGADASSESSRYTTTPVFVEDSDTGEVTLAGVQVVDHGSDAGSDDDRALFFPIERPPGSDVPDDDDVLLDANGEEIPSQGDDGDSMTYGELPDDDDYDMTLPGAPPVVVATLDGGVWVTPTQSNSLAVSEVDPEEPVDPLQLPLPGNSDGLESDSAESETGTVPARASDGGPAIPENDGDEHDDLAGSGTRIRTDVRILAFSFGTIFFRVDFKAKNDGKGDPLTSGNLPAVGSGDDPAFTET